MVTARLVLERGKAESLPMRTSLRFPVPDHSPPISHSLDCAVAFLHVGTLAQSKGYAHGLKPSQWTALRYFAAAAPPDCTVSAFSAHQGATRGAASQMVEVLVGKGLLSRNAASDDRRVVRLQLTEPARDLLRRDPLQQFAAAIAALPEEQQSCLWRALEQLAKNLRGAEK